MQYNIQLIFSAILFVGIMALFSTDSQIYAQTPQSTVVNGKYVTISDHRFRDGEFSDQITGTVINNATQDISVIHVFAGFYDSANQLITMTSGFADVNNLPPGDNSPFTMSIRGLETEDVDHIILYAGGLP